MDWYWARFACILLLKKTNNKGRALHTKKRLQLKVIATALCAAFFAQELQAAPIAASFTSALPPQEALIQRPESMDVPLDFAQLSEVHRGSKDVFIIHIQDAHSNVSGQQNLSSALDALMKTYGIRLVMSEGGEGDCSLTKIKKVASPAVWERVAKSFLLKGEIQGEEYLNLVSDHPMKIVGVEDMKLYDVSLSNYAELAEKREEALSHIQKIGVAVEKLKNKLYPSSLKSYETSKKKGLGFESIFPELLKLRVEAGLGTRGPETEKLVETIRKESALNFGLANLERAALLEELHRKGKSEDLEAALAKEKKVGRSKSALLAHFEKTLTIARENNLNLSKYENLNSYLEYLRAFAAIDLDRLFIEMDAQEDELYEKSLQGDALLVRRIDRFTDLLSSAHEIQMTTSQHERFKTEEPDFGALPVEGFLNRKLAEQGYFDDLVPYDMTLEEARKAIDAFYDSVSQRDEAFAANAEKLLQAENQKVAFLITGGYHTEHLKALMKEKGFGYAVITPLVERETNQKKYESLLLSQKRPAAVTASSEGVSSPASDGVRVMLAMQRGFDARLMNAANDNVPAMAQKKAGARLAAVGNISGPAFVFKNPLAWIEKAPQKKTARLVDEYREDVFPRLAQALENMNDDKAKVILIAGLSGAGKTTFTGRLRSYLSENGKDVEVVSVDSFIRRTRANGRLSKILPMLRGLLTPGVTPEQSWTAYVEKQVDRDAARIEFDRIDSLPPGKTVLVEGAYAEDLFGKLPNTLKIFADADVSVRRNAIKSRNLQSGKMDILLHILVTFSGMGKTSRGLLGKKSDFDFILDLSDRQHPVLTKNTPSGARLAEQPAYEIQNLLSRKEKAVFLVFQTLSFTAGFYLFFFHFAPLLLAAAGPVAFYAAWVFFLTAVFWQFLYVYRSLALKRSVPNLERIPSGLNIFMATTFVPSKEIGYLEKKLEGFSRVKSYGNKLTFWVLDEENDPRVRASVEGFNRRHAEEGRQVIHVSRKDMAEYNEVPEGVRFKTFQARQKGGNINAWLDSLMKQPEKWKGYGVDPEYDIVTFMDADHVPFSDFYANVLPFFAEGKVDFVQAPESFTNEGQNFITRAASFERKMFYGYLNAGYFGLQMPNIVGAHTTFRKEAFADFDGYYPVHLAEDYRFMLELAATGKKGVFLDKVIAEGEVPSSWPAYIGQQRRWATGGLDLLFRYFPGLIKQFSLKQAVFYFGLLNYYAWGVWSAAGKAALYFFLLSGHVLTLSPTAIVDTVGIGAVIVAVNYAWERQFFIEPEKKAYIFDNILMNYVMAPYYFVSFIKAIFRPNRPFEVTQKGSPGSVKAGDPLTPLILRTTLITLAIDSAVMLGIFLIFHTNPLMNAFTLPLMVHMAINTYALFRARHLEKEIGIGVDELSKKTRLSKGLSRRDLLIAGSAGAAVGVVYGPRALDLGGPAQAFSESTLEIMYTYYSTKDMKLVLRTYKDVEKIADAFEAILRIPGHEELIPDAAAALRHLAQTRREYAADIVQRLRRAAMGWIKEDLDTVYVYLLVDQINTIANDKKIDPPVSAAAFQTLADVLTARLESPALIRALVGMEGGPLDEEVKKNTFNTVRRAIAEFRRIDKIRAMSKDLEAKYHRAPQKLLFYLTLPEVVYPLWKAAENSRRNGIDGVDTPFFVASTFAEGYIRPAQALINGSANVNLFMTRSVTLDGMGLEAFGLDIESLKSNGFLRRDYKEGTDYRYALEDDGHREIWRSPVTGQDFPVILFKNSTASLEAMGSLLASRKKRFLEDARKLGYDAAALNEPTIDAWTYVYFSAKNPKQILAKFGPDIIGNFNSREHAKDARYTAQWPAATAELLKRTGLFESSSAGARLAEVDRSKRKFLEQMGVALGAAGLSAMAGSMLLRSRPVTTEAAVSEKFKYFSLRNSRLAAGFSEGELLEKSIAESWQHLRAGHQLNARGDRGKALEQWWIAAELMDIIREKHPQWIQKAKDQERVAASSEDPYPLAYRDNVKEDDVRLRDAFKAYGYLYSIGIVHYIRAEALSQLVKNDLQMRAAHQVRLNDTVRDIWLEFPHAQGYDPHGWVWQIINSDLKKWAPEVLPQLESEGRPIDIERLKSDLQKSRKNGARLAVGRRTFLGGLASAFLITAIPGKPWGAERGKASNIGPLLKFLDSNMNPDGLPLSYQAPPADFWLSSGHSPTDLSNIVERLTTHNSLNIYDGMLWAMTQAYYGDPAAADLFIQRLLSGRSGELDRIRANSDARGLFFRMISSRYLQTDPMDGKTQLEGFPDTPQLHHADWKPILGENAWVILGAVQIAAKKYGNQIPLDSPEIQLALSLLEPVESVQSPAGAFFYASPGYFEADPTYISNENNLSMYRALKILREAIGDKDAVLSGRIDAMTGRQEDYFTQHLYDSKAKVFRTGGHWKDGKFVPQPGPFAVDVQTWGINALGPDWIVRNIGKGDVSILRRLWQQTKKRAGYLQAKRFRGLGFTSGHDVISSEWTFGGILAAKKMAQYYCSSRSKWAKELDKDIQAMLGGTRELLVESSDGSSAYKYSNRRYYVPFGWWANPIPSTAGTVWAILTQENFDPFIPGGGLTSSSSSSGARLAATPGSVSISLNDEQLGRAFARKFTRLAKEALHSGIKNGTLNEIHVAILGEIPERFHPFLSNPKTFRFSAKEWKNIHIYLESKDASWAPKTHQENFISGHDFKKGPASFHMTIIGLWDDSGTLSVPLFSPGHVLVVVPGEARRLKLFSTLRSLEAALGPNAHIDWLASAPALRWERTTFTRKDGQAVTADIRRGTDPQGPAVILVPGYAGIITWGMQLVNLPESWTVIALHRTSAPEAIELNSRGSLLYYYANDIPAAVRHFGVENREIVLIAHSNGTAILNHLYGHPDEHPDADEYRAVQKRVRRLAFLHPFMSYTRMEAVKSVIGFFLSDDMKKRGWFQLVGMGVRRHLSHWTKKPLEWLAQLPSSLEMPAPVSEFFRPWVSAPGRFLTKRLTGNLGLLIGFVMENIEQAMIEVGVPRLLRAAILREFASAPVESLLAELYDGLHYSPSIDEKAVERIRELGAEVMIVVHEKDPISQAMHVRHFTNTIPNVLLHSIDEGANFGSLLGYHVSHFTDHAQVNRMIEKFVKGKHGARLTTGGQARLASLARAVGLALFFAVVPFAPALAQTPDPKVILDPWTGKPVDPRVYLGSTTRPTPEFVYEPRFKSDYKNEKRLFEFGKGKGPLSVGGQINLGPKREKLPEAPAKPVTDDTKKPEGARLAGIPAVIASLRQIIAEGKIGNRSQAALNAAELNRALMDLNRYLESGRPQQLKEAKAKILAVSTRLALSRDTDLSQRLIELAQLLESPSSSGARLASIDYPTEIALSAEAKLVKNASEDGYDLVDNGQKVAPLNGSANFSMNFTADPGSSINLSYMDFGVASNKGYGRILMEWVKNFAAIHGVEEITLATHNPKVLYLLHDIFGPENVKWFERSIAQNKNVYKEGPTLSLVDLKSVRVTPADVPAKDVFYPHERIYETSALDHIQVEDGVIRSSYAPIPDGTPYEDLAIGKQGVLLLRGKPAGRIAYVTRLMRLRVQTGARLAENVESMRLRSILKPLKTHYELKHFSWLLVLHNPDGIMEMMKLDHYGSFEKLAEAVTAWEKDIEPEIRYKVQVREDETSIEVTPAYPLDEATSAVPASSGPNDPIQVYIDEANQKLQKASEQRWKKGNPMGYAQIRFEIEYGPDRLTSKKVWAEGRGALSGLVRGTAMVTAGGQEIPLADLADIQALVGPDKDHDYIYYRTRSGKIRLIDTNGHSYAASVSRPANADPKLSFVHFVLNGELATISVDDLTERRDLSASIPHAGARLAGHTPRRAAAKWEQDKAALLQLLDSSVEPLDAEALAVWSGIDLAYVKSDLKRVPNLRDHPNLAKKQYRSAVQRQSDITRLKQALDQAPSTVDQLAATTGIQKSYVKSDTTNEPALKNHPNLVKDAHKRSATEINTDRNKLKALLDERPRTARELSQVTGIPILDVNKDIALSEELNAHPNLLRKINPRSKEQLSKDRAVLKELLDDSRWTAAHLSKETGIPLRYVWSDLNKAPALKGHKNLVKEAEKRTVYWRQVHRAEAKKFLDQAGEPVNIPELARRIGRPVEQVRSDVMDSNRLRKHPNLLRRTPDYRSEEVRQADRAEIRRLLEEKKQKIGDLQATTGMDPVTIRNDLKAEGLTDHPNLLYEKPRLSQAEQQENYRKLKVLLAETYYTARQLSKRSGIPYETVRRMVASHPFLKGRPNLVYVSETRPLELQQSNWKLLKKLLDQKPHTIPELAELSGIHPSDVWNDFIFRAELRSHPNLQLLPMKIDQTQSEQGRLAIFRSLNKGTRTLAQLSEELDIPILTVWENVLRRNYLAQHKNLQKRPFKPTLQDASGARLAVSADRVMRELEMFIDRHSAMGVKVFLYDSIEVHKAHLPNLDIDLSKTTKSHVLEEVRGILDFSEQAYYSINFEAQDSGIVIVHMPNHDVWAHRQPPGRTGHIADGARLTTGGQARLAEDGVLLDPTDAPGLLRALGDVRVKNDWVWGADIEQDGLRVIVLRPADLSNERSSNTVITFRKVGGERYEPVARAAMSAEGSLMTEVRIDTLVSGQAFMEKTIKILLQNRVISTWRSGLDRSTETNRMYARLKKDPQLSVTTGWTNYLDYFDVSLASPAPGARLANGFNIVVGDGETEDQAIFTQWKLGAISNTILSARVDIQSSEQLVVELTFVEDGNLEFGDRLTDKVTIERSGNLVEALKMDAPKMNYLDTSQRDALFKNILRWLRDSQRIKRIKLTANDQHSFDFLNRNFEALQREGVIRKYSAYRKNRSFNAYFAPEKTERMIVRTVQALIDEEKAKGESASPITQSRVARTIGISKAVVSYQAGDKPAVAQVFAEAAALNTVHPHDKAILEAIQWLLENSDPGDRISHGDIALKAGITYRQLRQRKDNNPEIFSAVKKVVGKKAAQLRKSSGARLAVKPDDRVVEQAEQLSSDAEGLKLLASGGQSFPASFAWMTPAGVAVIGVSGNVVSVLGPSRSQIIIPEEIISGLKEQKLFGAGGKKPQRQALEPGLSGPALEYVGTTLLGLRALKAAGISNVELVRKIDAASVEAEHAREILAIRALLGKNIFFTFIDRATGKRIEGLSDTASDIPKNAQTVLLGEALEAGEAAQKGWRFVSTEAPDMRDGEAGFLPLASVFVSGVLVGRADSIFGNDLATQFFRRVTRSHFGQEQYRLFVKPVAGQTSFYDEFSIKNIIRIPVEQILLGARMAIQALGSAA